MREKYQRRPQRPVQPREEHRVLFPRLGKYVVQWGRGGVSRIEFYDDPASVNRRLARLLYVEHRGEAQARLTTFADVVQHYQNKL